MFDWVGKQAVEGAIQKFGDSGEAIGSAMLKAGQVLFQSTVIPPVLWNIVKDAPQYWEGLPKEQKQALFNALVAAGTKALESYAKKPS